MTNLQVLQGGQANEEIYIDSLEVAEMTGKLHKNLLRDIENYTEVLLGSKLSSANFFVESNYKDSTGRTNKSYLLTRKGCDMVANKMTGEKGILFTAAYIDRFHEMEKVVQQKALPSSYKEALLQLVEQVEANEQLRAQIDEQAPAIEYHDKVLSIEGYATVTDTAKALGIRSAQMLNKMLLQKKIVFMSKKGDYLHTAKYNYMREQGMINYKALEKKRLQLLISETGKKEIARLLGITEQ
ncbi:Rha family transcriptional regulator [Bacillus cereus]|nr:Rha family transcriptional regulator [Bacillus cereus]PGP88958.1 Rha family transcriptional regulator [Bacillus cereus]